MNNDLIPSNIEFVELIHTIRNLQVMLDTDLAHVFQVETKYINRTVKRNLERFPDTFRFQLTKNEFENLRFQNDTSSEKVFLTHNEESGSGSSHGGRRYLPYAYSEQGVTMLSTILRSQVAIKVSIQVIMAFVEMRKFINNNINTFYRLDNLEHKQLKTDHKIEELFQALEAKDEKPRSGILYDGQTFDAYKLISKFIKSANKSIILIDNYIDESILTLMSKKKTHVSCIILTKNITKQILLDQSKFNQQYGGLKIKKFTKSHDRFLILDQEEIYLIGASLKDLGKKWFAFAKMDKQSLSILRKLEEFIKKKLVA